MNEVAFVITTGSVISDSRFVLCELSTAWFDEFVNSVAAIVWRCGAIERVCAGSNVPIRRR